MISAPIIQSANVSGILEKCWTVAPELLPTSQCYAVYFQICAGLQTKKKETERVETVIINPSQLVKPRGYNHGIKTTGSATLLFLGGPVGWDSVGRLVGETDIACQFHKALENLLEVVKEAGGRAENIVKLNLFVTDKKAYLAAAKEIGKAYRSRMGKHFPAMTLVEVTSLYENGAMVEIEGLAVL
jgi:enamine deaminase RidA (YjgF/YER057c/UK114 family)